MRTIVDARDLARNAASTSELGRFETESLASEENFAALVDLPGAWIDRVNACRLPKVIKIGAKVVRHVRYVSFQLAEIAFPRRLFAPNSYN